MPRFFAVDAAAAERIKNKQARRGAEAQRRRGAETITKQKRRRELFTCTRLVFC